MEESLVLQKEHLEPEDPGLGWWLVGNRPNDPRLLLTDVPGKAEHLQWSRIGMLAVREVMAESSASVLT